MCRVRLVVNPQRSGTDIMSAVRQAGQEESLWPKHHRIYLVLQQAIAEGEYREENPMPGEMALAKQFGVSRITIRKALERLSLEGRVERHQGRGTFARRRKMASPVMASLSGNIENLIAMGLETQVRLLELEYLSAPDEICDIMAAPPETVMQRAVRIRSLDGKPFSHLTSWIPEKIGRTFSGTELETTPLLQLIERAGPPIEIARQTITACLAPPEVARLLEIEPGDALLAVRRTVFDTHGRAVERISGLYRPDTYQHETSFTRSDHGAAPKVWNI